MRLVVRYSVHVDMPEEAAVMKVCTLTKEAADDRHDPTPVDPVRYHARHKKLRKLQLCLFPFELALELEMEWSDVTSVIFYRLRR